jgi:hypothetical protein
VAVDVRGSVMPAWRWDVVESPGGKLVKRFKTDAALNAWLKRHDARKPNPLLAVAGNPGRKRNAAKLVLAGFVLRDSVTPGAWLARCEYVMGDSAIARYVGHGWTARAALADLRAKLPAGVRLGVVTTEKVNPPLHQLGGSRGMRSYESPASLLSPGPGAWQRIKHIGSMSPAQVRAALGVESRRIQGEGAAADDSGDLWPAWRDESAPAGPKITPPKPGAKSWYVEPTSYAKKHGSPGPHKDSWASLLSDSPAAGLKSAYIGDMSRKQIETALKGMAGRMAEGGAAPDTGEPWPNPGSMKWGPRCENRSCGPFATVAALHAAAKELLRRVHPESQMAAAARLALRFPDMVMAQPVYQAALVDMLLRYPGTPAERAASYRGDVSARTVARRQAARNRNPGGVRAEVAGLLDAQYEKWLQRVDSLCLSKVGCSVHDLEDAPLRDWFDSGRGPAAAAVAALKRSGLGRNPGGSASRGRVFGAQVEELKYRHVKRGARVHTFAKRGTKLEALPDGSVRIFNPKSRLWEDRVGT